MNNDVKCIAFYLPQYHEIPENNEWWGEGFTEWTNVRRASPLFEGHYQPKIPLNNNYYCLLDAETLRWQAKLAKKYGIFGFCYYHYWFKDGKKLLEKPAELMLGDKSVDLPFCFCWANENWARTWDGGNNEVIMPQEYGGESEWKMHLEYFLPFFGDERYIKIDNKPVLLIYRPDIIPDLNEMLAYWKKEIHNYGFEDIYVISQHPAGYFSVKYNAENISKFVMFEPQFTRTILQGKNVKRTMRNREVFTFLRKVKMDSLATAIIEMLKKSVSKQTSMHMCKAEMNDYDSYWKDIIQRKWDDPKLIPGAFVNWDNIARKRNGMLFLNASPDKFKKYMKRLVSRCRTEGQGYIFINAWNEWGEGAYLEPDEKNGYRYLIAIENAMQGNWIDGDQL